MKFIKTQDHSLAEKLKESGFKLISENNGMFTFLNDTKLPFKFSDNTKIYYSDKLEF